MKLIRSSRCHCLQPGQPGKADDSAPGRTNVRLIIKKTSHIMMLVEGTSLSVSQWDKKLREANWCLCSSDDGHHRAGIARICKSADNCGSEPQKIWYAIFEIDLSYTSTGKAVWKGGQVKRRVTVVHTNHAVARQHVEHATSALLTCSFSVHIFRWV